MTMMNQNFEVDIFNQYHLKEGAKYSKCPLCSDSRSRSNKNIKCASLDWNRGLGTCHHCGEVFQIHTYKRKEKSKPYYAYKTLDNGKTKYYHDDGTETTS